MNLYAEYIKEREGFELLSNEHGFISYRFIGDIMFLSDIFVKKEFRRSGEGASLIEDVLFLAKDNGCKQIMAEVQIATFTCSESLKSALNYGFKVISSNGSTIVIGMEVSNG